MSVACSVSSGLLQCTDNGALSKNYGTESITEMKMATLILYMRLCDFDSSESSQTNDNSTMGDSQHKRGYACFMNPSVCLLHL